MIGQIDIACWSRRVLVCFSRVMADITEEAWQRAFKAVKEQFEIDQLLPKQEDTLREFLKGHNVFVNLPTGYSKSLTFQCLPIAADALFEKPRGSSVVVVKSPLRSLMEDQVAYLTDMGVRTGEEVNTGETLSSDPSQILLDDGESRLSANNSLACLAASESSLSRKLFSSPSNFSICWRSPRRFFSFATQFLQM